MKTCRARAIVSASSCLVSTCAFNLFETKNENVRRLNCVLKTATWKGGFLEREENHYVYFFKSSPLFID